MQLWSANPGVLPRNLVAHHQSTGNVSSRQVFEATLFLSLPIACFSFECFLNVTEI